MSDDEKRGSSATALLLAVPVLAAAAGGAWWLSHRPIAELPTPPGARTQVNAAPAAMRPVAEPQVQSARPVGPAPATSRGQDPSAGEQKRAASQEISNWTTPEAALRDAERTGKPILLDFNADWCGPCQRLKREVFDDPTFGLAIQRAVVPVSIVDRRREEGRNAPGIDQLKQQFGVNSFPTLAVYSARTGKAVKSAGYMGPEATVRWVQGAAAAVQ